MTRLALSLAALLWIGACTSPAGVALLGANVASLMHSDKTLTDHAVSWATEKDCSVLHAANKKPYCNTVASASDAGSGGLNAGRYCYRTLGEVSCYDRPDYTASSQTRINFDHGLHPEPDAARALDSPLAALPEGTY